MTKKRWSKTLDYYTRTHRRSPGTARGLDWSEESQYKRFKVLLEGINNRRAQDSVLDIGCGYGDLSLLVDWTEDYRGIDLNPLIIETAQEKFPGLEFAELNLEQVGGNADWVVSSGAFNVKIGDNEGLLRDAIRKMWEIANRGVVFNVLTAGSHVSSPDMHFYDAGSVLNYCRSFAPKVVCRMDYLPHDATYYMYRE